MNNVKYASIKHLGILDIHSWKTRSNSRHSYCSECTIILFVQVVTLLLDADDDEHTSINNSPYDVHFKN